MLIDARGFGCPKPVTMAEEEISKIDEGAIEILVDNEPAVKNLARFASNNSFFSEAQKVDNYWKVKIVKGYKCEVVQTNTGKVKDVLLVIGTDTMGKEDALGRILMKGFFETILVTREAPHTIFFLNAGVKLTTIDNEIIAILKEIEQLGVEIYSCGTCLKHYNLESGLKVGHRGSTNHIVEGIKDFDKTVWI